MPTTKQHTYKTKSITSLSYKSWVLVFVLVFGFGIANAGNTGARVTNARDWELITKYPKGAELNSSKFPAGTILDGDYKLEIPKSNQPFFEASTEFQNVLNDFNTSKEVNIEIIYLVE